MGKIRKLVLLGLTGVAGLLLTLAGINLIELSQKLILYSGASLLVLTGLIYFFY